MVGLEEFLPLSDKLLAYFEMIEKETDCQIVLRYINRDDGDQAEKANNFKVGAITTLSTIELEVNRNHGLSNVDLEHSLAHEATHGYLMNGKGYCRGYARQHSHEKFVRELAAIVTSIVDDIVVSKVMADHGLPPFASTYLVEVKRETKEARKNPNYYPFYQEYPEFRERFITFGQVLAWGYLQYVDLPEEARDTLSRFIKGSQNVNLSAYKMAQKVNKIIQRHDIFTPQGHRKALEETIRLWDLDEFIVLWDA